MLKRNWFFKHKKQCSVIARVIPRSLSSVENQAQSAMEAEFEDKRICQQEESRHH
jgi:hypothetical protein